MPSRWSEDITIAELSDEPALSEDLAALIEQAGASKGVSHVVLNFAGVGFVSSSGFGQLLELRAKLSAKNRKLVLCGMSDEVRSSFGVTGLDRLFRFAPDPLTALAGLQVEGEAVSK
jgi:anti-anti-sigma factor